jgi:hypothetical protein
MSNTPAGREGRGLDHDAVDGCRGNNGNPSSRREHGFAARAISPSDLSRLRQSAEPLTSPVVGVTKPIPGQSESEQWKRKRTPKDRKRPRRY